MIGIVRSTSGCGEQRPGTGSPPYRGELNGELLAFPSIAQDEADEEPDAAGSTPGSPPPMLNPAST